MKGSSPETGGGIDDLFPLADWLRPRRIEDVFGQEHLTSRGRVLADMVKSERLGSLILWGPPGSGKTTLSRILAESLGYPSMEFSATVARIAEIRSVMQEAESARDRFQHALVVFVDEIHHFNKHMQDAFLPFVERGDIILLGTTTENPAFKLNRALISRLQILELNPLGEEHLQAILERADNLIREKGLTPPRLSPGARSLLFRYAAGDARRLLNGLEVSVRLAGEKEIAAEDLAAMLQKTVRGYDRSGDDRYQLISAFHKSVRNSDMDASLYWLHRMLKGGEDPLFVLRRMIRISAEDIGLADPQAMRICLDAKAAFEYLGAPEGEIFLTMATVYLASAPKSNTLYLTEKKMVKVLERYPDTPVPMHLINPSHFLAARKGAGSDYLYAHDFAEKTTNMPTMPKEIQSGEFYAPGGLGFERTIRERILFWMERKKAGKGFSPEDSSARPEDPDQPSD